MFLRWTYCLMFPRHVSWFCLDFKVISSSELLRDLEKPPVHSSRIIFYGCEITPFYNAMFQRKEVCISSLLEPTADLIIGKPCLEFSMFNLVIVLKTTNADTCFVFCRCLSQKKSSKKCSCLSWWWGTRTTTSMRHSVVGAWSCMKRIFPPYRSSWNHTWI